MGSMPVRTPRRVTRRGLAATSAALALSLMFSVASALALPGDLDTSFSGDGKTTTSFTSGLDWANATAVQADGKIVVAGTFDLESGFAVARYNANGTLDTAGFGGGDGMVTIGGVTEGTFAEALAVAIQPSDQKIVVAGYGYNGDFLDGSEDFALARLNTNGNLDTAGFGGGDGTLMTRFTDTPDDFTFDNDRAEAVGVQADGDIVAAGSGDPTIGGPNGNESDFAVARYNSDGLLDSGFGGDGRVTLDIAPTDSHDVGYDLALLPGNKVLVAGFEQNINGRGSALAQFDSSGLPDATFDGNGIRIRNFEGVDELHAVARQPDGKLVVGGFIGDNFVVMRFNAVGTNDNTFDGNGYITTSFNSATFDQAWNDLALEGNGRIVTAGVGNQGSGGFWAVGRFFANGAVDRGFGTCNGAARTSFGNGGAEGMAIDGSGRVVVAGFGGNDFGVARYLTTGSGRDCTNPNTTIKGPSKTTKRRPVYRLISTEPGSTFRCRINGRNTSKPFNPCSSPFKMPRLKLGPTRFEVRAIDRSGNPDPSPAFKKIKRIRRR
jgi:uncharacterized delta-60 repeat protein